MPQPLAFGLSSLYDPSIASDQSSLDRNALIAQMLRQQAMTPVDTSGRQIGGVAYKTSPLEGLAKVLQGYMATKTDQSGDQGRMLLAQKQAAALGPMFDQMMGGNGQGPATSTPAAMPEGVSREQMEAGGFPQPPKVQQTPLQGETQGDKLKRAAKAAFLMGNQELGNKLVANYLELTPEQKNMAAKGQNPQEMGVLETAEARRKAVQPTRLGNAVYADAQGVIHGLPQPIVGAINIPDQSNPSGFRTEQIPGGIEAIQRERAASALGSAAGEVYQGYDANGNPLPARSKASVLGGAPAAPTQPSRPGVASLTVTEPSKNGAVFGTQPLGTEHAQKGLDTSWEALKSANREAQNTKSYLQNIVTAAEKGAIVGPGADRREMIQGMLQLAGIKEEVNTNATSQTQLLNKYANQIVTRLGASGGLSTDAARAMLQSAYPGQHMNVDAIREAVGNLNGAQDMVQAKTRFLTEPATKRDTATFQQREIAFDQAADPRIWQYKAIRDPAQRAAFAKMLMQQDPTISDRIKKLEALGAL